MDRPNAIIGALFAVCAIAGTVFQWWTQPEPGLTVAGNPHVQVEHVNRRQPLTVKFTLQNQSSKPIVIDSLQSGCSCVTSEIDGTVVPPRSTVSIAVTVRTFDAYAQSFMQQARVLWAGKSLVLTISGTLSPSDKVLYRPVSLVLKGEPAQGRFSSSLVIRVPKHCSDERSITAESIAILGLPDSQVQIEPLEASGHYREYRIVVTCPSGTIASEDGAEVKITTPCESIVIPISVDNSSEPTSRIQ